MPILWDMTMLDLFYIFMDSSVRIGVFWESSESKANNLEQEPFFKNCSLLMEKKEQLIEFKEPRKDPRFPPTRCTEHNKILYTK